MAVCELCDKKVATGNNVSFSKRHTRRKFHANIQRVKVLVGEKYVSKTVCAKCLKALSKTSGKGITFAEKVATSKI
jgi:large subunit ribosomal protein L28